LVGIPKITEGQIKITQFLGSGAFGEVYEGYWTNAQKVTKVAIKVIISSLFAYRV
jgi:predicted Ser/Thr protein kinase